jgi:hypothetical protein
VKTRHEARLVLKPGVPRGVVTDAASVQTEPSSDTWILYVAPYAASQFNATVATVSDDPKSTCHH